MNARFGYSHKRWLEERMEDPEFRAEYERQAPAFEVTKLRLKQGLTQKQLAQMIGTRQSSISRLESGRSEPSLSFLRRVVEALEGRLEVRIVPRDELVAAGLEESVNVEICDTESTATCQFPGSETIPDTSAGGAVAVEVPA